jgi:hypothetical protein
MSLKESFMQAYQKLSPEDKERLHHIIKHLGEKLPLSGVIHSYFPLTRRGQSARTVEPSSPSSLRA